MLLKSRSFYIVFNFIVMWENLFFIGKPLPWAWGQKRFNAGPSSTRASLIYKNFSSILKVCFAFARADNIVLEIIGYSKLVFMY